MTTIRELLNRIRWDQEYGGGNFAIGYFDRIEQRIVVVPLGEVRFQPYDHSLVLYDGRAAAAGAGAPHGTLR